MTLDKMIDLLMDLKAQHPEAKGLVFAISEDAGLRIYRGSLFSAYREHDQMVVLALTGQSELHPDPFGAPPPQ